MVWVIGSSMVVGVDCEVGSVRLKWVDDGGGAVVGMVVDGTQVLLTLKVMLVVYSSGWERIVVEFIRVMVVEGQQQVPSCYGAFIRAWYSFSGLIGAWNW